MNRFPAVVLGVMLLALLAGTAMANGTRVTIELGKVPSVTNFGSAEARGQAEITLVEGDVTLTVTSLPRLNDGLYQAWLTNTKTGERLSIAKFNSTADATAKVQSVVSLGNREWDLFVITVEPEPDPTAEPDSRIVLAGWWPERGPGGQAAPAAATATRQAEIQILQTVLPQAAPISTVAAPTELPRTGGPGFEVLFGALALLGAGAWLIGRGGGR